MKKYLFFMFFVFFAAAAFGYCSMPVTLANSDIPCVSGLSTDPSKVHAYLWLQGKADWTIDNTSTGANAPGNCVGGCDSDGMDVVDEGCWNMTSILISGEDCAVGNPGEYYLLTDWSTSPTGIGYDGCPSADSSERAILLIYDDDGKYVLQSRSQGKVWTDWDEIGTTAADYLWVYTAGLAPFLSLSGDEEIDQVDISFSNLPTDFYGNYEAGDAPSSALITGFRIYYYPGADDPPTNFSASAWIPGPSYPVGTTTVYNMSLPTDGSAQLMSRSLIIDGVELPVVSRNYVNLGPGWGGHFYHSAYDPDQCSCNGISYYVDSVCFWVHVLVDGTTLHWEDPDGLPLTYYLDCGTEHTFQYREQDTGYLTWFSPPITATDVSQEAPSAPAITSIVDNDPNGNTGVTINFTPGTPALRHDLYRDSILIQANFTSGSTVTGLDCNVSHSFRISAVSDYECWTVYSDTVSATDECIVAPGELALGATSGDALIFSNDKTTTSWPSYAGANGYRLYRGTQADLANLPGGAVDNSCLRYDGVSTSIDLSGDTPASESFFWYLVTAYNGSGEGPAGTGRVINSSGGCP